MRTFLRTLACAVLLLAMGRGASATDQSSVNLRGRVWRIDREYNDLGLSRTIVWVRVSSMVSFFKFVPVQCLYPEGVPCVDPAAFFACAPQVGVTVQLPSSSTFPVHSYKLEQFSCASPVQLGRCVVAKGEFFRGTVQGGYPEAILNPKDFAILADDSNCSDPNSP